MIIHKCDRCGIASADGEKGSAAKLPDGWYRLDLKASPGAVEFHLCPKCRQAVVEENT